jgi:hypothetical protein|tara:strand:- start:497 stop:778 length:282 start_codon:yes stop_codon:yes gene_type:complete
MIEEETLTKEEKQKLKDNPRTWRVYIDKTVTEEFIVDAYTQDEAEDIARNKSESYSKPDGSEVEDVSIRDSELDRCTYVEEEIEYLEEEVLNA